MLVPPAQFSQACQDPSGFAFVEGDLSSLEQSSLGTPHAIRPGPYLSPSEAAGEGSGLSSGPPPTTLAQRPRGPGCSFSRSYRPALSRRRGRRHLCWSRPATGHRLHCLSGRLRTHTQNPPTCILGACVNPPPWLRR